MFLTELDVINDMLATMGETPLNAIDEDHPFVASGRRTLATANRRVQNTGWWFNTDCLVLTADQHGFIYCPTDLIRVEPIEYDGRYVQRGRRIFDRHVGTFAVSIPHLRVKAIRLIPFEELDGTAQDTVRAESLMEFQLNYDADEMKLRMLEQGRQRAWMELRAEDLRQEKPNFLSTTTVAEKLSEILPVPNSHYLPTMR